MKKRLAMTMIIFGTLAQAYTMEDCKAYLEEGVFVNQKLKEAIYRKDSNGVLKQMMQHSIDIGKETVLVCEGKLDSPTMNNIKNGIAQLKQSIKSF